MDVDSEHQGSWQCRQAETASDLFVGRLSFIEGLIPNLNSKQHNHMGGSINGGTLKSSILIGFSLINHPFRGTPMTMETPILNSVGKSGSHSELLS